MPNFNGNFNGAIDEVKVWLIGYIARFYMDVITYPNTNTNVSLANFCQ